MNHEGLLCELSRRALQTSKSSWELSSGWTTTHYVDCKLALSQPSVLSAVAREMRSRIIPSVEAVGGLTMGADPIAIAISIASSPLPIRWFSVRKEPKQHGMRRLIEGGAFTGDKVCVVDDVVTSGASVVRAIEGCRSYGLHVVQVMALVDRTQDGMARVRAAAGNVPVSAMFTMGELLESRP